MAGSSPRARARARRRRPRAREGRLAPGGSMLLSSGVVWRYRDFEEFRASARRRPALQRLVWERLDDALDWLERLGAPCVARHRTLVHDRPRFEPRGLWSRSSARRQCRARRRPPGRGPLSSRPAATGRLARERGLLVRSNPWSDGEGIELALARGGRGARATSSTAARCPARSRGAVRRRLPALRPLRPARNDLGEEFFPSRCRGRERPCAGHRCAAGRPAPGTSSTRRCSRVHEVAEKLPYAQETSRYGAGGPRVRVYSAVTHTLRGRRVDTRARAVDGVWSRVSTAAASRTAATRSGLAPGSSSMVSPRAEDGLSVGGSILAQASSETRSGARSRAAPPAAPGPEQFGVAACHPLERAAVDRDLVRRHRPRRRSSAASAARPGRGRAAAARRAARPRRPPRRST
jgi:hypothetical protein